jgi:hypothetical protein
MADNVAQQRLQRTVQQLTERFAHGLAVVHPACR